MNILQRLAKRLWARWHPPKRATFPRKCLWCEGEISYDAVQDRVGHTGPSCDRWSAMCAPKTGR